MQRQVEQSLDVRETWGKQLLRPYVVEAVRPYLRKAAEARGVPYPIPTSPDCIMGLRGALPCTSKQWEATK